MLKGVVQHIVLSLLSRLVKLHISPGGQQAESYKENYNMIGIPPFLASNVRGFADFK